MVIGGEAASMAKKEVRGGKLLEGMVYYGGRCRIWRLWTGKLQGERGADWLEELGQIWGWCDPLMSSIPPRHRSGSDATWFCSLNIFVPLARRNLSKVHKIWRYCSPIPIFNNDGMYFPFARPAINRGSWAQQLTLRSLNSKPHPTPLPRSLPAAVSWATSAQDPCPRS